MNYLCSEEERGGISGSVDFDITAERFFTGEEESKTIGFRLDKIISCD